MRNRAHGYFSGVELILGNCTNCPALYTTGLGVRGKVSINHIPRAMNAIQHRYEKPPVPPSFTLGLEQSGFGVFLYAYAVLLGACYLFAFWHLSGSTYSPSWGSAIT